MVDQGSTFIKSVEQLEVLLVPLVTMRIEIVDRKQDSGMRGPILKRIEEKVHAVARRRAPPTKLLRPLQMH
jgi:hypothetical protein